MFWFILTTLFAPASGSPARRRPHQGSTYRNLPLPWYPECHVALPVPAPPAQACTRRNKQAPRSYSVRSTALRASRSMGSIRPDTSVAGLLRRAGSGWLTGKGEIPSVHMKGEFWVHYGPTLWSLRRSQYIVTSKWQIEMVTADIEIPTSDKIGSDKTIRGLRPIPQAK